MSGMKTVLPLASGLVVLLLIGFGFFSGELRVMLIGVWVLLECITFQIGFNFQALDEQMHAVELRLSSLIVEGVDTKIVLKLNFVGGDVTIEHPTVIPTIGDTVSFAGRGGGGGRTNNHISRLVRTG
jgi:hypothetical protein